MVYCNPDFGPWIHTQYIRVNDILSTKSREKERRFFLFDYPKLFWVSLSSKSSLASQWVQTCARFWVQKFRNVIIFQKMKIKNAIRNTELIEGGQDHLMTPTGMGRIAVNNDQVIWFVMKPFHLRIEKIFFSFNRSQWILLSKELCTTEVRYFD